MAKVFDEDYYIKRNKLVALEKYGNRLDKNKNIIGTNYCFDWAWRLCIRSDNNG